jgi:diguanylate cyclase (GGDEF)-like protein
VPALDLFTLEIFTTLNMLLAGTALFLVASLNKRTSGVRRCSLACLLFVVGFSLYPARLAIPGNLIVLLPNLFVITASAILLDGVRAFRGLRRYVGISVAGVITSAILLVFYTFVKDDINARTVIEMLAFVVCAWFLTTALAFGVPHRDRLIYWTTAAVFGLHGVASLIKGCDAIWGPQVHFWSPRPWDIVFAITLNVCIVGCAFGLSMAVNLKLQRAAEDLAFYDSLTLLPNRRFFEENLERAEQRAFATGQRIALVYCDLDDFKGINDLLGHEGGDMALRQVGDRMREVAGENVCLARMGGDEFLLLVENAHSRDDIQALIENLRTSVEGAIEFEGRSAELKISCGVAIYPDDVGSVSDLIRLADAGMYMMKQHGRAIPVGGVARA